MTSINFKVDKEKCIHCRLCEKDCITKIINMSCEKTPYIKAEDEIKCLRCQHCLSICPVGAISILDKKPEESEPCKNLVNSDDLLNLMKSRRSFRQYKQENIPTETMQKLKDMLKFPPTGCNFHNLHFSIIEDVEVMNRFRNRTNNKLKKIMLGTPNNLITKKFSSYKKAIIDGEDVIYRNAPHFIVVSTPITAPCPTEDGIIALSYFELYAQSLGLGTCWCGFGQICLKTFPDLCEFLEIPDGYKPVYTMLFGPTDIKYKRCTQPEEYTLTSVKGDNPVDNISILKRLKRYFWNMIR